jgi:hypothetical protein
MALQRENRILAAHAETVVAHANEFLAAAFDFDVDAARARIEGVFHQFLDGVGGPFNHFAGGDLIGDFGRKSVNARHEKAEISAQKATEIVGSSASKVYLFATSAAVGRNSEYSLFFYRCKLAAL